MERQHKNSFIMQKIRICKSKSCLALLVAILPASFLLAQTSTDDNSVIKISADAAQFRINDSLCLGEIYFAVARDRLNFIEQDKLLTAQYKFDVEVWHQKTQITSQSWTTTSTAASRDEIKASQFLFNVAKFQFKPGSYTIKAITTDLNSQGHGEKSIPLTIRSFPADVLALSDIEMATNITRDSTQTVYTHNGYRVVPNPGRLYGDGLFMLRFYMELYNLDSSENATYSLQYRILDATGETVKNFQPRVKKTAATDIVEIGGINVVTLRTGVYTLQVNVVDNGSGQQAKQEQVFYIYRERDMLERKDIAFPAYSKNLLVKLYETYDEKKLDDEFSAATWIATPVEKEIYQSLDIQGKQQFMGQFWYSRDPDSTTVRNEYREDYLARAEYANANFGGLKVGCKSDRGRILLMYGIPSEIERFPSEQGLRSYQIWHYFEQEGGISFWFVDAHDWGDYNLVNSTARDELRDPEWQRWLTVQ